MRRRYHLPVRLKWDDAVPAQDRARLAQVILTSVRRAVERATGGESDIVAEVALLDQLRERFAAERYDPADSGYRIPSFQDQGAATEVPVETITFQEETITPLSDHVVEEQPPFQDAVVLALPGNHYVRVKSHRYAVTRNVGRAYVWGKALFGAETWVIAAGTAQGRLTYYVAALDEALTESELRVQSLAASPVRGVTGVYRGRVLDPLPGGYAVIAVSFKGGGLSAPSVEAFADFQAGVGRARRSGETVLPTELVRGAVFAPIDALILRGGDDDIQRAAELLAELNADVFATLDWQTRERYIEVLIRAWTDDPQEIAIVEIIKSVESTSELRAIFQRLREAELWDQLFHDLDSELWSLLVVLGQRFGDPAPLDLRQLVSLLLEARLWVLPGIQLGPHGPELSVVDLSEVYEAARSFIRFLGGTIEGIWSLVAHPDRLIDGVGQLAKMIVMANLAQAGYPPAVQMMTRILEQLSRQVVFGLKGAEVTGMASPILSRIKWAVIWEVASWFIGIGEIRAAVEATGLTEKLSALARLLRVLGLAGRAVEGEQVATKLERLAAAMSRSSRLLGRDEEILHLLSLLPEEDVGRLSRLLEGVDIAEGIDLARLTQLHPELGEAASGALRKAEVLNQFAGKAGGLTDEVVEAFAVLARPGRLPTEDVAELVRLIPQRDGARFARALRSVPEAAFSSGGTAAGDLLRLVAPNAGRMDALANIGFRSYAAMYEHAGRDAERLDQLTVAVADLEVAAPEATRAGKSRRLLDALADGDARAWEQVENARRARFGLPEERLDPATVERWIDEEISHLGGPDPAGASPIAPPAGALPAPPTGPPRSFFQALRDVDMSGLSATERAALEQGWQRYRARGGGRLRTADEYIRFRYGKRTGQLPSGGTGLSRDLGEVGEVERRAGHLLQRVLDANLPAGSANARDFPTRFGNVRPDHLPPGGSSVRLDSLGRRTASPSGTSFSARFVADSKYRDFIPSTEQTRGFASLARYSDDQRLVFYVRWQESFPAANTLPRGAYDVGFRLPDNVVPQLVAPGVRDVAQQAGVEITLVTDPLWR